MKIVTSLPDYPKHTGSCVLTIGNFDGVHLGHKAVINRLKEVALQNRTSSAILTFSNHPTAVLSPQSSPPLLCTIDHKIRLLEKEHPDFLILLPFTLSLAKQSADVFLRKIKNALSLDTLILGDDATIGKGREGDQSAIAALSKKLGFQTEYLSKSSIDGIAISSSAIRKLISQGELAKASQLLGRPFSIYAPIINGLGRGSHIGFPTANIAVENLCLPPLGVYAVTLQHLGQTHFGVANLGIAPTVRNSNHPILEVHLFNHSSNLYGEYVEVSFDAYIRPERRFEGIEQLKAQIAKDIAAAQAVR